MTKEKKNANEIFERFLKSSRNEKASLFFLLGMISVLIVIGITSFLPRPSYPQLTEYESYGLIIKDVLSGLAIGLVILASVFFDGKRDKLCKRCKKDLEVFMNKKPVDTEKKIDEVFNNDKSE
jgi:hypothetical protein